MSRRDGTRTRRRVASVAVAALWAALGPASSASATPPDPDAVIEVMPGDANATSVQITDDAVYFVVRASDPADPMGRGVETLYRRTVTVTPGGHELGTPQQLGRVVPGSSFAVHAGTVAYVRAVDGHLVLRAPDDTETLPDWGTGPAMAFGVRDLSTRWAVVTETRPDPEYTLIDRQTGATYDLGDLVPVPAGYTSLADAQVIDVTDDRVLWGETGSTPSYDRWFHGVYTIALGATGPVGTPTVLQAIEDINGPGGDLVNPVGLDGSRALWEEVQAEGYEYTSILHVSDAPYATASSTDVGRGSVLGHNGSTVVFTTTLEDVTNHLRWIELPAGPGPETLVVDLHHFAESVHGTLVAFWDPADEKQLADASGGTLVGDQAAPPPSVPFTDTYGTQPFTDEILWLADRGVVGGYPDGTFRALPTVSRQAMAAFLYRAAHDGARAPACTGAPFADVPTTHPFCGDIDWLADAGITTGWPDGAFRGSEPVSRGAMAAFLYRLAHDGADAPTCAAAPFGDVPADASLCGEIAWLADTGISTGWSDGTFRPTVSVSRQAMAAFLFRFIDAGLVPAPID